MKAVDTPFLCFDLVSECWNGSHVSDFFPSVLMCAGVCVCVSENEGERLFAILMIFKLLLPQTAVPFSLFK